MGPSRRVAWALFALLPCAPAQAQDDVLQRLNEDLASARYADALEATDALADRALAAEWRSYLYGLAGDLPAALREARAGLEVAPAHVGLLTQALNASLTLGLAAGASELAQRLQVAAGEDPALRERAAELSGFARELAARQELAERSVARSRAVALAGLLGASLALALLARGGARSVARA